MNYWFALAILAVDIGVPADVDQLVEKEMAKLQGAWTLVGGEEKGEKFTEEEARKEGLVCLIKGNKITLLEDGKTEEEMTFKLDPAKKPAAIDFTYTGGKQKGRKNHAIYAVEGDELKICVSRKLNPNNTKERPTEFAGKTPNMGGLPGMVLFIFKREKK